jgi:hypothetical protein
MRVQERRDIRELTTDELGTVAGGALGVMASSVDQVVKALGDALKSVARGG